MIIYGKFGDHETSPRLAKIIRVLKYISITGWVPIFITFIMMTFYQSTVAQVAFVIGMIGEFVVGLAVFATLLLMVRHWDSGEIGADD